MFRRMAAGLSVAAIGAFWLIAWIPMALYCGVAALMSALRGRAGRFAG